MPWPISSRACGRARRRPAGRTCCGGRSPCTSRPGSPPPRRAQEATYLANCLAVYHEHVRLEPYIRGAMPWIVRRCVTRRLLQFDVGPVRLAVAHDVPSLAGLPVPAALAALADRDAVAVLSAAAGVRPDGAGAAGVGARDWTKMRERMRYIFQLFRLRHLDPGVLGPPYGPAGLAAIAAGPGRRGGCSAGRARSVLLLHAA